MSKMLRMSMAGFVSLVALSACQPLQAQTTFDPLFLCGVAGGGNLTTTQGLVHLFPLTQTPSLSSISTHPAWTDVRYSFFTAQDLNSNILTLSAAAETTVTEPEFLSGTLEIRNGTTVVGTQELYVVVFADALHLNAFLYYVQQREAAATPEDYLYFSILCGYEFWIGQENTGLALYSYYTGMASYLRDTQFEENPEQAMYDYYYNIGLGAYYYFEGIGDLESANLAFAYYYELAIAELPPEEELPPE